MQTTLWSKCIQIEKFGEPNEVSILCTIPIDPRKWNENAALIRWIASPINLLDLNIIKGKYKKINTNLNKFPCIGGTEGVGLVERVGSNVHHLCVGDLVININYWLNNNQNEIELNQIWTEWDIIPSNSLFSIDKKINLVSAATLGITPPIAWTLLNDFVKLEKGDWIIQNAANSDIGITIIQLAKAFGYFTLNLIEDKQDSTSLRNELYSLGATKIFNEKEFCNKIT
uniref:Enoyl-[acyl-carrier-protein] reductase, mitochondrial n=1 Tax=Meloidogyne incognita TaxID=6306 RepID=A0A914L5I1_MELIC